MSKALFHALFSEGKPICKNCGKPIYNKDKHKDKPMLKISRDTNGNKTLKFSPHSGERGFSVQTNGNMPKTHAMSKYDFNEHTAQGELYGYIKEFGTKRQQDLLDV